MEKKDQQQEPVLPEDAEMAVTDYLIGEYELERLKNGFQPPVLEGEPCPEHQLMFGVEEPVE